MRQAMATYQQAVCGWKHSCRRCSSLAALCSNAVKGMASLIGSGTVRNAPTAIAAFLREHKDELDTTQIGEYFGHHEEQAVRRLNPRV